MRADRRGVALLEVLVSLAILTGAGAGLVAALAAAMRSEHRLRREEAIILSADRVLAATTLLSRADLERRIGTHPVGDFVVQVQRPRPTLYRIAIAQASTPEIDMLATVVHRPESVQP
jgi:type II secretory pathway component PulJ